MLIENMKVFAIDVPLSNPRFH